MPSPNTTPSDHVSEKSTKAELWDAYRQLRAELEKRPVAVSEDPAKFQNILSRVGETKAALVGSFDATLERLTTAQAAFQAADLDLSTRKAQLLDELEQERRQLEMSIAHVRQRWDDEQADRERTRVREQDAYDYNLKVTRRDAEAAYTESAKQREANLAERETALAEREKLVNDLQRQVDNFPAELDTAVKTAKDALAKDLTVQHQSQLKDQRLTSEHAQSILKLKLDTAESGIAAQAKQVADLQRQVDAVQAQLKEMALAAISAKSQPAVQPSQTGPGV